MALARKIVVMLFYLFGIAGWFAWDFKLISEADVTTLMVFVIMSIVAAAVTWESPRGRERG